MWPRHFIHAVCLVVVFTPALTRPAEAQDALVGDIPQETQEGTEVGGTRFHLELGLGVGSNGLGGLVAAVLRQPRGDFLLRSAGSTDFEMFGPTTAYSEVAILYGHIGVLGGGWTRVGLRPAVAWKAAETECLDPWILGCSGWDRETRIGPGIALQADAVWTITGFLGLGVGLFGDLNTVGSFGGAVLTVNLGKVR